MPIYYPPGGSGGGAVVPSLGNPTIDGGAALYVAPGWMMTGAWGARAVQFQMYDWHPWYIQEAVTLDEIAFSISTAGAAGALARLALYDADEDWQPTTRVSDFGGGTIAADSLGVKGYTALGLALPVGRYVVGLQSTESGKDFSVRKGAGSFIVSNGGASLAGATFDNWRRNAVNAAFPNPASAGIKWQTVSTEGGPFIFGRFS